MTTLYLVWYQASAPSAAGPIVWDGDAHSLNDMMWLVRSERSCSALYHETKWQLPKGAALMVAPLDDRPACWPKFKGMDAGALAWLRGHSRS